jgi:hypothetical protein
MKKILIAAAAVAALSGTAHAQSGSGSNSNAQPGSPASPMIDALDATIEGNTIGNVTVEIDRPGYVVIHNDAEGAPPASLGHIRVDQGRTGNINIEATGPIDPATNPTLMLHYETNDNETYDFGPGSTDVDTPVMNGSDPVVVPVTPAT